MAAVEPARGRPMGGGPGAALDPGSATGLQTVVKDSLAAMTTQTTPAGAVASRPVGSGVISKWMLPGELGPEDKAVLTALDQLFRARTMAEHHQAFARVARDVVWDAPPVLLSNREAMRVMVYTAKRIAKLHLEPVLIRREVVDAQHHKLHVETLVHLEPLRPFWPLTWLVPRDIPIRATIVVGVFKPPFEPSGSWGVIDSVWGRWHNYPSFPNLVRMWNGLWMGHMLRWTEGLWSQALPLIGDSSVVQREATGTAGRAPY